MMRTLIVLGAVAIFAVPAVQGEGTTAPTTCTSVETSEGTYTCVGNQEECVAGFGSGGAISPAEMSDIVNCCCQPTAPSVQQCYAQITAGQDCPSGSKILTLEECKQAAGSSETEWVGGARLWDHTSDGYPTGILDGYPTGGIGCYSNSVTTYFSVNAAGHANAGHTALCTTPCPTTTTPATTAATTVAPHHSLGRDERNFCHEKEARGMFLSGVFSTCDTHNETWCEAGFFTKGLSCDEFCSNVGLHCEAGYPLLNRSDTCAYSKATAPVTPGTTTTIAPLSTTPTHYFLRRPTTKYQQCASIDQEALKVGDWGQMGCNWARHYSEREIEFSDLPVAVSFKCDSNDNIHLGFDSVNSRSSNYQMRGSNVECQNGNILIDWHGSRHTHTLKKNEDVMKIELVNEDGQARGKYYINGALVQTSTLVIAASMFPMDFAIASYAINTGYIRSLQWGDQGSGQGTRSDSHLIATPLLKWAEAEQYCVTKGGHLASIHSADDDADVRAFMQASTTSSYPWIGGISSSMNTASTYTWSDGTSWDYTNPSWGRNDGHPNFVHYYRGGTWGTLGASSSQHGICRIQAVDLDDAGKETQIWDVPGTYTYVIPSGASEVTVEVWGGGGGGGTGHGQWASGGGGGGYSTLQMLTGVAGSTVMITVGAGGAGMDGIVCNNDCSGGQGGGASRFGTVSAGGGEGGDSHSCTRTSAGGVGTTGTGTAGGLNGGGNQGYGGGGAGANGGAGGAGVPNYTPGLDGSAPGGGGSGGPSCQNSHAGGGKGGAGRVKLTMAIDANGCSADNYDMQICRCAGGKNLKTPPPTLAVREGLLLWFDGNDAGESPSTTWLDKSGNDYNAVAVGGDASITTIGEGENMKTALVFENNYMTINAYVPLVLTMTAVFRSRTSSGFQNYGAFLNRGIGDQRMCNWLFEAGATTLHTNQLPAKAWKNGAEGSGYNFDLGPIGEWMVVTIGIDENCGGGTSKMLVGRSGHSQSPIEVAEIVAYNRVLTDEERLGVETYLAKKWLPDLTIGAK